MYRTNTTRSDVTAPDTIGAAAPPRSAFSLAGWLRGGGIGWVLFLIPLALFIWFMSMVSAVASGEVLRYSLTWVPSLDIELSFAVDGLGLLFAIIVSGVGTLVFLYTGGYMAGDPMLGRFYLYLSLFMFAMLGVVLTDNIFALFIAWELTSITSYLLISFKHNYQSSRNAGMQALLTTGAGGLALMAGLVLMAIAGGSWEFSTLVQQGEAIQASPLFVPMLVLLLLGAFTKSAQFPFYYWLPGAMAAPTPVSAYLHSATMVNAGVYLLARINPVFEGAVAWQVSLIVFGAITMVFSATIAVLQVDLKRILAFTTVSALGTMVLLIGVGGEYGMRALVIFFVVHALYKGALFMVAGSIDHEAGTRDITKLGELWSRGKMRWTAIAAGLAALSMMGMIPFYGFIGKEAIYEATLESHFAAIIVTAAAVFSNTLMIIAAGMVAVKPFYQRRGAEPLPKVPHEAPLKMVMGPVVLGVIGLLIGLLPYSGSAVLGSITQPLLAQGVAAVTAVPEEVKVYLIPKELSLVPILSVVTIALGVSGYWGLFIRRNGIPVNVTGLTGWVRTYLERGPERAFDATVSGMQLFAALVTKRLQSGYLRNYLLIITLTVTVMTGWALLGYAEFGSQALLLPTPAEAVFYYGAELAIYLLVVLAALFITQARTRLAAVAGLGAVGFGVAIVFMLNSAPDLAMTQFSIEILSVIIFVLVLYRLPELKVLSRQRSRIRDAIVGAVAGVLMTLLILFVNSFPTESRLSPFFAETSYTEAHGRNVVNVILVDYRGFDTMGEIAVLGIAALGIFVLMRGFGGGGDDSADQTAAVAGSRSEGEQEQ